MKTLNRIVAILLIASVGVLTTNCFGSFELTKKVYNWNDTVTENKFVKTLLFYGMSILQIYTIGLLVDVVIFNLIEFWDGSNPLSMNEGEVEEKFYAHKGVDYKVVATKNQFEVIALNGKKAGSTEVLRFDNESKTWYHESDGNCNALMTFAGENNEILLVHTQSGETIQYALNSNFDGSDLANMYRPLYDTTTMALRD
jgi:hypothetical protein